MKTVYIIGAGATGLAAGWKLSKAGVKVVVIEAAPFVGGMAATFRHEDMLLDFGPHKFFSLMEDRMLEIEALIGEEDFLKIPKKSRIRLMGRFINFPVGLKDLLLRFNPLVGIGCFFSYLFQLIQNALSKPKEASYEDWLITHFGRGIYNLIFGPYAAKIWGPPQKLARELAETRVAIPSLMKLLINILTGKTKGRVMSAAYFRYPKKGTGEFSRRMAEEIVKNGGEIFLKAAVQKIIMEKGCCRLLKTSAGEYTIKDGDAVISTIPLSYQISVLDPPAPPDVAAAVNALEVRDLVLLYMVFNRPKISDDNWFFFPESKYIFSRVFEQKNFSPAMIPENKTVLCLEIVCAEGKPYFQTPDQELYDKAVAGLEDAGLAKRSEVLSFFTKRLKNVYPVYDIHYKTNTLSVLRYLDSISNYYSIGRQGGFNYVGQVDCLDIGSVTAESILTDPKRERWKDARRRFESYVVID